jgi:hypothetical protein
MRALLAAVTLVGVVGGAVSAAADEPQAPAKCELRVIHALKEGSGIDSRITRLRPYLERAPFTAWHEFKLLSSQEMELAPRGSSVFDLPNGRKGTLTYVEHMLASDGDHRMRLQLVIDNGPKRVLNTTFVLDEGGVVLQAGQKYQGGLLVLGVSCKTEK